MQPGERGKQYFNLLVDVIDKLISQYSDQLQVRLHPDENGLIERETPIAPQLKKRFPDIFIAGEEYSLEDLFSNSRLNILTYDGKRF